MATSVVYCTTILCQADKSDNMMRVLESRCNAKQASSTACRWSIVADVLAVAVSSIHASMVIQSISPHATRLRHICQLMMSSEGRCIISLVENCVPRVNDPSVASFACFAYTTFLLTRVLKKGAEFSRMNARHCNKLAPGFPAAAQQSSMQDLI